MKNGTKIHGKWLNDRGINIAVAEHVMGYTKTIIPGVWRTDDGFRLGLPDFLRDDFDYFFMVDKLKRDRIELEIWPCRINGRGGFWTCNAHDTVTGRLGISGIEATLARAVATASLCATMPRAD